MKILTKSFFLMGFGLLILSQIACKKTDFFPRPKAYLSLTYPAANYNVYENEFYKLPFNDRAFIKNETQKSIELYYTELKASLFLNYTSMEIPYETLKKGIETKLGEHQKKATAIIAFPYKNPNNKKEGVLYEIQGNAASAAQFYISDGKNHFLSGALYFNIKPQYDSIYPAAHYLLNDMREIMDYISWAD